MKKSIHQKAANSNRQADGVKVDFTGKNLTRFGGSGLIRRFFKRHKIKELFDSKVSIEGGERPENILPVLCLEAFFMEYSLGMRGPII